MRGRFASGSLVEEYGVRQDCSGHGSECHTSHSTPANVSWSTKREIFSDSMDLDAPTTLFLNPKRRTQKMIEDDSLWDFNFVGMTAKLATCVHRSCDWTSSRTWRGTEKEEMRTMGFGQVNHQMRTTCARLASERSTLDERAKTCLLALRCTDRGFVYDQSSNIHWQEALVPSQAQTSQTSTAAQEA